MRYIQLEITPEDIIRRTRKENHVKHLKCVPGEDEHAWYSPKEGEKILQKDLPCTRCEVKYGEWLDAIKSQGVLCGDKGVIVHFLEEFIRPESHKELRRWNHALDAVRLAEEPGTLKLEEDDWEFLDKKFSAIDFDAVYKDQQTGRELPIFNKLVMERLSSVVIKIEEAKDKAPVPEPVAS